jgi:hypothetical protein
MLKLSIVSLASSLGSSFVLFTAVFEAFGLRIDQSMEGQSSFRRFFSVARCLFNPFISSKIIAEFCVLNGYADLQNDPDFVLQ